LDADCDLSLTTTTLVRDSTLDSVSSPSCGPPQSALLDLEPCPTRPDHGPDHGLDHGSTRVQVVNTAADMDDRNDVLHESNADDAAPEPEVVGDRKRLCACADGSVVCEQPACDSFSRTSGTDAVTAVPEVVVGAVDNWTAVVNGVAEDGARQYLYDDVDGHYSPAGRGYPHGFRHSPPAVVCVHSGRRSPKDRDQMVPDLAKP